MAHLRDRVPHVIHNHMYRAEVVGTRAALALSEAGLPRPYVVGTVHSSRVRSDEDRDLVRALTPHMDRLIAVSRAIVAEARHRRPDRRSGRADLQRRRPLPLRPAGGVLHAAGGVRLRGRHPARRRRRPARAGEGPSDAPRGLAARSRPRAGGAAAGRRRGQPPRGARGAGGGARAARASPARARPASARVTPGRTRRSSSPAAATTCRR